MIDAMLGTGRVALVDKAEALIKHLKQIKALDWKVGYSSYVSKFEHKVQKLQGKY